MRRALCIVILGALALARPAAALTEGPAQPEAMQFEPADTTDVVNLATGDFTYNVALFTVPGPAGDYPLNLSYHAGIGPNAEATWVGLGWSLNAGSINRTINGYPDDYSADYVEGHNEVDAPIGGVTIGVGVSFGYSYGSVGLNMSYDSFTGNFGPAFVLSAFGVEVQASTQDASIGFGTHWPLGMPTGLPLGVAASVGISLVSGDVEASGGLALGVPANTSIGFSLSSRNGWSGSYSLFGVGAQSMTTVGAGTYTREGNSFSLPILPFLSVNLSAAEWRWDLDESYLERAYGYLHQERYLADQVPTQPVGDEVRGKKYERIASRELLLPSQDIYLVQAQGLSGVFRPHARNMFMLRDGLRSQRKGQLVPVSGTAANRLADMTFRFLGDPGANFVTNGPPLASPAGLVPQPLDSTRPGARRILPRIDPVSGKIGGFVIVESDGTTYEFLQPVFNWLDDSRSFQRIHPSIGGETVERTLESRRVLATPYAVNWLLTAIKGPDFVDRDGNAVASDGDWGYWVRFGYRKASNPQIWRSPHAGLAPSADSADVEGRSVGMRDVVLLERVETPSHLALFTTSARPDRLPATLSEELPLPGRLVQRLGTRFRNTFEFHFPGDWTAAYAGLADDAEFLDVTHTIHLEELESFLSGLHRRLTKRGSRETTENRLATPTEPDEPGPESYDWTIEFDGHETIITLNLHNWGYYVYSAHLLLDRLVSQSAREARKLDRVDLYGKSDAFVTRNAAGEWHVNLAQATPIRSARFQYDYSLCPGTPNSEATAQDGAAGGKLTLKSVELLGRGGASGKPPYLFRYANDDAPGTGLNPPYNLDDFDTWGSFRDPQSGRGPRLHQTPQSATAAAAAAAWSLTDITLPEGGTVQIEYEADDYYHVGTDLDRAKFAVATASGANDEELAYQITAASPRTATFQLQRDTSRHLNNFTRITPQWADSVGMRLGRDVAIIELTPRGTYGDVTQVFLRQVADIAPFERTIASAGSLVRQFAGFEMTVAGAPLVFDPRRVYFLKLYPRHVFGGGVRVKRLTMADGADRYSTFYRYETADGLSSGATASLPSPYEVGARALPGQWSPQHSLPYPNNDATLPAPGVTYSRVEVINGRERGMPLNGKTVFEFATPFDVPLVRNSLNAVRQGNPGDPRMGFEVTTELRDRSVLYGAPRGITMYERTASGGFRPIRQTKTNYAWGNALADHGRAILPSGVAANPVSQPLGLAHERHRSENDVRYNSRQERVEFTNSDIHRFFEAPFAIESVTNEFSYAQADSLQPLRQRTLSQRTLAWDALSGRAIVTASSRTDGRWDVVEERPAHWEYPRLGERNMLTQVTQESERVLNTPAMQAMSRGELPTSAPVASRVTTWQPGLQGVWRVNDTYEYDAAIDARDGAIRATFDRWTYDASTYLRPTPQWPWRMTSNTTQYDVWSRVTEERNSDGTYAAAVYSAKLFLPTYIATNARLGQLHALDFESAAEVHTLGDPAAFISTVGEGRGGGHAFKAYPAAGPWYEIEGLLPQRRYRMTFWARLGTASSRQPIRFTLGGPAMTNVAWPVLAPPLHAEAGWQHVSVIIIPLAAGTLRLGIDLAPPSSSGGWHYIDDLRIEPEAAQGKVFGYDPLTGWVTSISDARDVAVRFEYDAYGRLTLVRDHEDQVVREIEYRHRRE